MYNFVGIQVISVLVLQNVEKTNFVLALRETRYIVMVYRKIAVGKRKIVQRIRIVLSTLQIAQSTAVEMIWTAQIHQRIGQLTHASVTQIQVRINNFHFLKICENYIYIIGRMYLTTLLFYWFCITNY